MDTDETVTLTITQLDRLLDYTYLTGEHSEGTIDTQTLISRTLNNERYDDFDTSLKEN